MQGLALIAISAAAVWFVAVAFLMAAMPRTCIALVNRMWANLKAGNWRLNLIEQSLRVLAGAALILCAVLVMSWQSPARRAAPVAAAAPPAEKDVVVPTASP